MIRILHLTDFHLNKRTLRDWNDFYKKSFFEKIEEFQAEKKVDLIFFTGDLIDKGGKDFGGAEQGFIEFENNIINPILEFMGLDISRFIICPGNHDINRNADDEISENGLKGTLSSSEKIISFINDSEKKNNYNYIQRIKEYKSFEYKLYDKINVEKTQSIFKFSSKVEIGGVLIGISSLNSSWRCYDENDFGKIIIGENQVNDNYKFIENCRLKIALLHHQSDWFAEAERRIINSHINKNYDLVLSGHVHENISSVTTGFTGACFHNVSPSGLNQIRTDNSTFANGFTIIDYDDNVTCHYLKYNHSQKKFVDNTDVVDKGKITFTIPSVQPDDIINSYREAITNIIEDHYEEMNNHFIKGKNNEKDTTVKDAFIYPPIDDGKSYYDLEQTNTNLNDIINSDNHFLFLGEQESGKKSLLYRILVEYVEEFEIYKKIPIFIDFSEVGNKEFITIIKEYCRLGTIKAKEILEHGKFIILIDNLNYHESKNFGNQINKLHKFLKDYPKTRIIGTYENDNQVVLPPEILNHCKIPFSFHYLRGLKSKEIKQIMRQWLPSDDKIKNEESLEKLVNTFSSYHLSNNALSVHLYLWSLENTDRKPINQGVLMEIYIELILEKLNKGNIYRKNFDFTNKIQLISMIADYIIKKEDNRYILSYTEFHSVIHKYLKNIVGFSFDEAVIIDYLLDRKIFVKNNKNEVKFSQICFLHFFVAKRMEYNPEFKEFILHENRYFNYYKEIDYYTGLVRSDKDTFILIYERFKSLFNPTDFILQNIDCDDYFNINKGKQDKEPLARNIELAKIKESRPSDELIERKFDEQLARISQQREEIKVRSKIDFFRMMIIMCNVLRNSEGVEDLELKKIAYSDIVKHSLTFSILYTQLIIKFLIDYGKLPPFIPPNISLEYLLKNFPYITQKAMLSHLGTQKLGAVILDKMNKDVLGRSNSKSEIERYLSVALYSDIQGQNFDVYLRKLVKQANTTLVQDYLLYKLSEYLFKRSKPGSENESLYLDLISDLKIRTQKLPKMFKDRIIKDLIQQKNKVVKFLR